MEKVLRIRKMPTTTAIPAKASRASVTTLRKALIWLVLEAACSSLVAML